MGGHQFLTNMENPGMWGVLSEIPPMVGYGYFLEPSKTLLVCKLNQKYFCIWHSQYINLAFLTYRNMNTI